MFVRLVRDESGMTMGLVVIMIVLIGVMGAGLLTFVQRDLENLVEVNRGQKAIATSDAGIQAARRHLLANSFPHQYNDPATATFREDSLSPNSDWAFNSSSSSCPGFPNGPGKCVTTTEGNVRITITYLPAPTLSSQRTNPRYAPEVLPVGVPDYPDKRDYFRIEADGVYNGSRRKVQAILVTKDLSLPKAYFATRNIELASSATTISNVSLFAKGNVTGLRDGMLLGSDTAYGSWQNEYNDKARLGSSTVLGNDPATVGVGAEGFIEYDPTSYDRTQREAPAEQGDRYKRIDFDSAPTLSGAASPTTPTPNYRFCDRDTSCWPAGDQQPADVISYPFDDGAKLDAEFLRMFAEDQVRTGFGAVSSRDNYYEMSGGTSITIDEDDFTQVTPALNSVLVVRFTGPTKGLVNLSPNGSSTPCALSGTIVVVNGDLTTSSSGARCFDGVISVQDPNNLGTLEYRNIGNFTLNGFANVEGSMSVQGSVNPIIGADVLNQPGFHDVEVWSWRECYDPTCT